MTFTRIETELKDDLNTLAESVIGNRIVSAHALPGYEETIVLTLSNGRRVSLRGWGDCCAYGSVSNLVFNLQNAEHAITSVEAGAEAGQEKWFIFADLSAIVAFDVDWDEGTGEYGYGITISVESVDD